MKSTEAIERTSRLTRGGRLLSRKLLAPLLFGIVLWAFLPAIKNGFVGIDDPDYVTANDYVKLGLSPVSIPWAFRSVEAANWHPLTWLSHMLDCQLFGLAPWGHHLTSIVLHALNAVLAFWLLRELTGATWRSLAVAALFALHPLRVESVAWVAERKDVLSTTFGLLTLWMYARYAQKQSRVERPESRAGLRVQTLDARRSTLDYSLALVFFVLGLMSKPMLVTLPFIMLLMDYWPLQRISSFEFRVSSWRGLVLEKIPFFMLSAVMSVVTVAVQGHSGAILTNLPMGARLENGVVSYCRYLRKLFWPVDLAVFYPYPGGWPVVVLTLAVAVLAGISLAAVFWGRRRPWFLMGWLWYLGTLVPVIGVVQAGEQSMADRYSYVPSLGIFIAVIWGIEELSRRWRYVWLGGIGVVAVALVLCARLTREQISYWKDSETLFRYAIQVTQGNYVAYNNLGVALDKKGKHEEALGEFGKALRVPTGNYLAHNNLGVALDKQGRFEEAIEQFRAALQDRPGYAEAAKNLGIVLYETGRHDEAIDQFRQALKYRPDYPEAHDAWGTALERQGHLDQAIDQYREALRQKPDYSDAHYNLGVALGRSGRPEEAVPHFLEAIKLKPNSADAHNNLGVTLERLGRIEAAIQQYRLAVRIQPDFAKAHFNLGVAVCRTGDLAAGIAEFREALRLKPDYVEAQKNLEAALGLARGLAPPAAPATP